MEIQIINPRIIYLVGSPYILKEKRKRTAYEKLFDSFDEDMLVYKDLVFTLQNNSTAYHGPKVRYQDGKFVAVSNLQFLRALKEAQVDSVIFGLIVDGNIPLEQLIENFNLSLLENPIKRETMQDFLFFHNTPKTFSVTSSLVIPDSRNFTSRFQQNNCLAYKILLPKNPSTTSSITTETISQLFYENGYIRSINGICDKSSNFGKYFR